MSDLTPPIQPDTVCLEAITLYRNGNKAEAQALLEELVRWVPDHVRSLNVLAVLAFEEGQFPLAESYLERLLTLAPDFAKGWNTRGQCYLQQHAFDAAAQAFLKAIALEPELPEPYGNLGHISYRRGDYQQALRYYSRFLDLVPTAPQARHEYALALRADGQTAAALAQLELALEQSPHQQNLYIDLAETQVQLGQLGAAKDVARAAREATPDNGRIDALLGYLLLLQGHIDEALHALSQALTKTTGDTTLCHSNLLLTLHYSATCRHEDILAESKRWAARIPPVASAGPQPLSTDGLIRVGYVSGDFKNHVVANFLEPLLVRHDRRKFRIHCYSNVRQADDLTRKFMAVADVWHDIGDVSDDEVCRMIRADRIDLLIDLSGHTACNRLSLFARKPAPIQLTWLGYPGTTGLQTIDYRLTDTIADPPGLTDHLHSEKLYRLAPPFLCFQPPANAPAPGAPPALAKGHVTFGTFNNISKITPSALETWATILTAVPDSRLVLKSRYFVDPETSGRFYADLAAHGIARERIELLPFTASDSAHLASYHLLDIALDTFPYNGATTTLDALFMGVPVVTLAGHHHVCRVGASLLTTLGEEELIAHSVAEYVAICKQLAQNREQLIAYRQTLRQRLLHSPLCDADAFTRRFEAALAAIFSERQQPS